MTLQSEVLTYIEAHPGASVREIVEGLRGNRYSYFNRVVQTCWLLRGKGLIERTGTGGRADPFRYTAAGG